MNHTSIYSGQVRHAAMFRMRFAVKDLLVMTIFVLLGMFVGPRGPAAESFDLPFPDGGFETVFEQGDITVSSEIEVNLHIGAADEHFVDLTVSSAAETASIMVQGLAASMLYYVYLDDFNNLTEYTTTVDGSLSLSFPLVEALPGLPKLRHVIIQDEPSTLFLRNDATGGDCETIGLWDATTKTCTLTQTVTETIQIDADAVTLDCNNQIIEKGNGSFGITNRSNANDITVKNCRVQGAWNVGIYVYASTRANIVNNRVEGAYAGIALSYCKDCQFLNNSITNGVNVGFRFVGAAKDSSSTTPGKIINNTITNTPYGWQWGTFYTFLGCVDEFFDNTVDGKEVHYLCQTTNAVLEYTDTIATIGVFGSDNVTISNVLFPGGVSQSIFMQFVTNSLIEGIDTGARETGYGIEISDGAFARTGTSTNVTIRGNQLHDVGSGVFINGFHSTHILIENNKIVSNNGNGVRLAGDQHTVTNNDIGGTLTGAGLAVTSYGGNIITKNTIHDHKVGMLLARQGGNGSVYRDNIISGNIVNVDFSVHPQRPLADYDTDFDASNLVDDKTVRILDNSQGETVTGDWAMVLVLGGDGVTIENVTTGNNNDDSIALVQTNNSTIRDSTIGGANHAVVIAGGHQNQILNNTFVPPDPQTQKYQRGISLESTSGNRVSDNTIQGYWYGIYLDGQVADSEANILNGNVITESENGIYLYMNSPEWILHNNSILNNDITTNRIGVALYCAYSNRRTTSNLVSGNQIHGKGYGLYLLNTSDNTITNNLFFGFTTTPGSDIRVSGNVDTDDKVFGNDFFSGIYANLPSNPLFCDPNATYGTGNFYDRSVLVERTRFGPCGIADTPFTEGGLARDWQAVEQCRDAKDNDEDGLVDLADSDCGGSFYTELEGILCVDADEDGYAYNGGECGPLDCNDDNAEVNPSVLEVCLDNQDNNCDGQIDECTAEDNVQTLIEKLQSEEVAEGTEGSLVSKLGNAIKSLDRENQSAALNQLGAFENEVEAQRGKHLTHEQADYLLQVVASIREDIETGTTP